jgi:hypothetical protein
MKTGSFSGAEWDWIVNMGKRQNIQAFQADMTRTHAAAARHGRQIHIFIVRPQNSTETRLAFSADPL